MNSVNTVTKSKQWIVLTLWLTHFVLFLLDFTASSAGRYGKYHHLCIYTANMYIHENV